VSRRGGRDRYRTHELRGVVGPVRTAAPAPAVIAMPRGRVPAAPVLCRLHGMPWMACAACTRTKDQTAREGKETTR
jgi:hypothetical protein